jgi:hypothetical protein
MSLHVTQITISFKPVKYKGDSCITIRYEICEDEEIVY